MITRAEQKALFDSINGDLVINTKPDGSGDDVVIPIYIYWGFEPVEMELPAIILNFITYGNPSIRTLGDLWKETEEGQFLGYMGEYTLNTKIFAADVNDSVVGKFVEKSDVVHALYQRILSKALWDWDYLIEDGGVVEGGISPANDVSQIMDYEGVKILQLSIRFQKLTGSVPSETGIVKFATAPVIEAVESNVKIN